MGKSIKELSEHAFDRLFGGIQIHNPFPNSSELLDVFAKEQQISLEIAGQVLDHMMRDKVYSDRIRKMGYQINSTGFVYNLPASSNTKPRA